MKMPPILNSPWLHVAPEPVIAAFVVNLCLQSVSDLETVYGFIEKTLIPEKKRGIHPHSVTSPIAVLQIALILIPEWF